jgi:1-acyl-sn-glycerol-3-phosphate acyltransferase
VPRFLRILFSGSAFIAFFFTAAVLGRLLLPIALHWPGSPERRAARRERILLLSYRSFIGYMRALRLITFTRPALPADFPAPGRPYLLISNHPSLIDVLVLTSTLPGLTSVAKASWFRSWLMRPLLEYAGYIPGADDRALPEAGEVDPGEDHSPVLERMTEHLRAHPLLVFPEASRSHERSMRRFRRGAIAAAIRAGAPIVPAFVSVVPPMLMKHQAWYDVPRRGGHYTVEFFPVIETAGRELDSRTLTKELRARYELRHAQMLAERDAFTAAAAGPKALPG